MEAPKSDMASLTKIFTCLFTGLVVTGCTTASSNKVSVDYYSISGNSTAELDKEIKAKGPRVNGGRHAVAVARIRMVPDIRFSGSPTNGDSSTCIVSSAKVNVSAKVTLPRWTGRGKASGKLVQAWENIDKYTRLHEAAHVSIAFSFARRMEEKLLTLDTPLPCAITRAKARQIVVKFLEEHDKSQKKFDLDEQSRFARFAEDQRKTGS